MDVTDIAWLNSASKRRRYLLGVSGGADSVALLHLLVRAGFSKVVVCHLDHRLRGRQSTEDTRFVGKLATRLDVAFESSRVDVARQATEMRESVETVGRRARHDFFAGCSRKWRCQRLLLAHHADDQAETVLWHLLRGSRGASGMSETQALEMAGRTIEVTRPLLGVRRAELRDWLRAIGERWREDPSNAQPIATRNRIRHEVMPLLEEVANRDVVEPLRRAADAGMELREIEQWAIEQAASLDPAGRLHLARLRELPSALRRACVFDYLRRAGVPGLDQATLDRVLGMLDSGAPARITLRGGNQARRRQGRIWVEPA